MNTSQLDLRLREWFLSAPSALPRGLHERVLSIPETHPRAGSVRTRRVIVLLAAALILGALAAAVAIGSGYVRLTSTSAITLVDPAGADHCAVLAGAIDRVGIPRDLGPFHKDSGIVGARSCAWGYDDGFEVPHLFIWSARIPADAVSTRLEEAETVLAGAQRGSFAWVEGLPGTWHASLPVVTEGHGFSAVATYADSVFFVVTYRTLAGAEQLSGELLVELDASKDNG